MNRDYENGSSDSAKFFLGTEVEHGPAYGMKTLFVVGVQPVEEIKKMLDDPFLGLGSKSVEHIYFGANHSFTNPDINDHDEWFRWESMIRHFLDLGYFCTLDMDPKSATALAEGGLTDHRKFIPMISVKLPYIHLLGYNAIIKLDDKGFDETNHGVWCHMLHDLMDRRVFTSWDQYKGDTKL
jgi:hypothetical protein